MGDVHHFKVIHGGVAGLVIEALKSPDKGGAAVDANLNRRFKWALRLIEQPCSDADFAQATAVAHFLGIHYHEMALAADLQASDFPRFIRGVIVPPKAVRAKLLDYYIATLDRGGLRYHPPHNMLQTAFPAPKP